MNETLHRLLALIFLLLWPLCGAQEEAGGPATAETGAYPLIEFAEFELELTPESPSAVVEHFVAQHAGLTFAYIDASHDELDLRIGVKRPDDEDFKEDDNSGGGTTPWVKLKFASSASVVLEVSVGEIAEATTVTLRVFSLHQSPELIEGIALAKERQAAAKAALERGDRPEVRRILAEAVTDLVAIPGARDCWAAIERLWFIGFVAYPGDALSVASMAWEPVMNFWERVLPPDHDLLLRAWGNNAAVLQVVGDIRAAKALQEKVLGACERTLPEGHESLQASRHNFAITLGDLGEVQRAKSLFEKVIQVYEQTVADDSPALNLARSNYAANLVSLGDLQGARQLHAKVLEVGEQTLDDEHTDLQHSRLSYAQTLSLLGDHRGAHELRAKALEVFERSLPEDHPYLQDARIGYSSTLEALGDLAKARALREKVLEVLERTHSVDHPYIQTARQNYARTLYLCGDARAALAEGEKVLAVLERILPSTHPNLQESRNSLAATLALLGEERSRLRATLGDLTRGIVHQQVALRPRLAPRRAAALATQASKHVATALSLSVLLEAEHRPELEERIFASIETIRCAESAVHRLTRLAPPEDSELAARVEALNRQVGMSTHAIARLAAEPGNHDELRQAIRDKEIAESELVGVLCQEPASQPLLAATTAASLATVLGPDEAAVSYWEHTFWEFPKDEDGKARQEGRRSFTAMVLRHDGTLTRIDLGEAKAIDRGVKAWRAQLRARRPAANTALFATASALRKRLLDPVLEAAGDVRRLYVATDGALHLLALDALPAGAKPDELVGDRVELRAVTALRDLLLASREPTLAAPSLLALGAIDYQTQVTPDRDMALALVDTGPPADVFRDRSFVPLPSSSAEVMTAAATFSSRFTDVAEPVVLQGGAATKGVFLARASSVRFLHLATHAWFAPDDIASTTDEDSGRTRSGGMAGTSGETVRGFAPMLLCGIALAGAGAEEENARATGILTAQEIASLDLSGCELAVLSACETSLGSRRPGQGVASLQQSLHAAGARLSLTSLWKVPDASTQLLMREFYRHLWELDEPPHQALWEAKRTLRNARKTDGTPLYTPLDYAGWILCGVPVRPENQTGR